VRRRSTLRRLLGTVLVLGSPLSVTIGERAGAVADVTVTFSTVGEQTWTVPRGVTSARFVVSGAQGGDALFASGGLGATVEAVVSSVTEGQQVELMVAGRGGGSGGIGGVGGGGDGAGYPANPLFGGAGGGGRRR
jgi:hypothetical protein